MQIEVEVEMAWAAFMTKTVKAMIAFKDTAKVEIEGAHLLPGYGLSFLSASAAFASVHSLHLSGGVVYAIEDLWCKNNNKEVVSLTGEEVSKETKGISQSHKYLLQEELSKDKDRW